MAVATHAIFSGPALDRLDGSALERVIVTDSIPLTAAAAATDKIKVVSVAGILGEAIRRIHTSDSVTSLFG
jgi:ribose-phosphate pyrophosphokinase